MLEEDVEQMKKKYNLSHEQSQRLTSMLGNFENHATIVTKELEASTLKLHDMNIPLSIVSKCYFDYALQIVSMITPEHYDYKSILKNSIDNFEPYSEDDE
jgi:hypothetical protein